MMGGWRAFDKTFSDVWRLGPRKKDNAVDWEEDDYVLIVWLLGSIVSILLFLIPGVPEGFWMIPAPFIPLTIYKGVPKLIFPDQNKASVEVVDDTGESKKSK